MNKDFPEKQLLAKTAQQQIKVLFELAHFIEVNQSSLESSHFEKLTKYHRYLQNSSHEKIQKLNKEFAKIKDLDRQFQIYLMNLERFLGQSSKEYEFLINTKDKPQVHKTLPLVCVLDSIRSAHNVGAMIRNAECFGAEKIILTGLCPTPEQTQVKKTAMGADEMLHWKYHKKAVNALQKLKERGYTIWAIETVKTAKTISSFEQIPTPLALVFGHELHGLSLEVLKLCDEIIKVSLYGRKNSLNVSSCQCAILNEICQRL